MDREKAVLVAASAARYSQQVQEDRRERDHRRDGVRWGPERRLAQFQAEVIELCQQRGGVSSGVVAAFGPGFNGGFPSFFLIELTCCSKACIRRFGAARDALTAT